MARSNSPARGHPKFPQAAQIDLSQWARITRVRGAHNMNEAWGLLAAVGHCAASHGLMTFSPAASKGLASRLATIEYFSPSWTAFQADRGRRFSGIVDDGDGAQVIF